MGATKEEPVEYENGKIMYLTWKILPQANGLYQAIRIRPSYFFTSTSLTSAVKRIDSLELHRAQHGAFPSLENRKKKLMEYLHQRKLRNGK
jgi:hypothetical protein